MEERGDVSLRNFEHLDEVADFSRYVEALETFDSLVELQELKAIARTQLGIAPGGAVLDVGCGFGLETLRLAPLVGARGTLCGLDKSAGFIAEARRRARAAGVAIDFREGDAADLPFADASFDAARAERLLIYLAEPAKALAELARVVRAGGRIALIEPDFETNTINLADRDLVRRILRHECDTGVRQGWLVRDLGRLLRGLGFCAIEIATRVVLFDQGLAAGYFTRLGTNALSAGVIGADEAEFWARAIAEKRAGDDLFCTIGYYLFIATR